MDDDDDDHEQPEPASVENVKGTGVTINSVMINSGSRYSWF